MGWGARLPCGDVQGCVRAAISALGALTTPKPSPPKQRIAYTARRQTPIGNSSRGRRVGLASTPTRDSPVTASSVGRDGATIFGLLPPLGILRSRCSLSWVYMFFRRFLWERNVPFNLPFTYTYAPLPPLPYAMLLVTVFAFAVKTCHSSPLP